MNGHAPRLVALVCAGLLCLGCRPRPCVATAAAAVALDSACAAAGLEKADPELLAACASQYLTTKRALLAGKCAAEVVTP